MSIAAKVSTMPDFSDKEVDNLSSSVPADIDPSQAWFWTPEWQAKEAEADAEIAKGGGEIFYSDEEFLAALRDY